MLHVFATLQYLAHALGTRHKGQWWRFLVFAFDQQSGGVADRGMPNGNQNFVIGNGSRWRQCLHCGHLRWWAELAADKGFHAGLRLQGNHLLGGQLLDAGGVHSERSQNLGAVLANTWRMGGWCMGGPRRGGH